MQHHNKEIEQRIYELDADALLFWKRQDDSLHILTGLGYWVLLGIEQEMSALQLWEEYCDAHPATFVSLETIHKLVSQVMPLVIDSGIAQTPSTYLEEYSALLNTAIERDSSAMPSENIFLRLNDLNIQINSDCEILLTNLKQLCPINLLSPPPTNINCQFDILTLKDRNLHKIKCNNYPLKKPLPTKALLPELMDYFQIMGYQSSNYLLAIHAAVVVKDGLALILPGLSGAGKSTLCVSLVEQGYTCYSDELAILGVNGTVEPLALPMAVKQGSWSILSPAWPEIEKSFTWQRQDGRKLKYLRIPDAAYPDLQSSITRQVIFFPQYAPDCQTATYQQLTPTQILTRLTAVGYQIKSGLNPEKIELLINFSQQTPAFEISYSSLDAAHQCIETLLSNLQDESNE